VYGLVEDPLRFTWEEFLRLPRATPVTDFHCVTGWSRLDNRWEGVMFSTVMEMAKPRPEAAHVTQEAENGYTTAVSIRELLDNGAFLAFAWEGKPLTPDHGGPLRLIVPNKYAYKGAKWIRGLRFTAEHEMGFWEVRGYSDKADPWREQRYSWDD
jgi:DMSO/TMAO reductase YedYZ molybdopterin-dependent catalytic subunit